MALWLAILAVFAGGAAAFAKPGWQSPTSLLSTPRSRSVCTVVVFLNLIAVRASLHSSSLDRKVIVRMLCTGLRGAGVLSRGDGNRRVVDDSVVESAGHFKPASVSLTATIPFMSNNWLARQWHGGSQYICATGLSAQLQTNTTQRADAGNKIGEREQ